MPYQSIRYSEKEYVVVHHIGFTRYVGYCTVVRITTTVNTYIDIY
jgi:hypothetical protein